MKWQNHVNLHVYISQVERGYATCFLTEKRTQPISIPVEEIESLYFNGPTQTAGLAHAELRIHKEFAVYMGLIPSDAVREERQKKADAELRMLTDKHTDTVIAYGQWISSQSVEQNVTIHSRLGKIAADQAREIRGRLIAANKPVEAMHEDSFLDKIHAEWTRKWQVAVDAESKAEVYEEKGEAIETKEEKEAEAKAVSESSKILNKVFSMKPPGFA